jgi:hypothetical protein
MGHVFGDSTSFPYDVNFIELIRHAVDSGVALCAAQHAIATAADRRGSVDQLRRAERGRLEQMSNAVKLTMTAFMASSSDRMVRTASSVLENTRAIIERELAALEGQASGEIASTKETIEHAREAAYRAVEMFVLKHDLPNTEKQLRLLAGEDAYAGQALVTTPFGVDAVFALAVPGAHEWGKLRRVAALSAGTEIRVPKESGWISKRVEMAMEKLDKLFVSEASMGAGRSRITLRKGPLTGTGWRLEVSTEERVPRALLTRLSDDGTESNDPPLQLDGEDAVHAGRLWTRIVESTRDLAARRQAMTSATFDGRPLRELDEPQKIVIKLVNVLAPIVQEIARRSGAPGELVLRRDVGEGRREEIYITKAELHEKVMTLPPNLRGVFDPLELSEGPRSPRAPAPSEPIQIDGDFVDADEDVEEPTRDRRP